MTCNLRHPMRHRYPEDLSVPPAFSFWVKVLCHFTGFTRVVWGAGWPTCIGCLKVQASLRNSARNSAAECRALSRKTLQRTIQLLQHTARLNAGLFLGKRHRKEKASYASSPPCRSKCRPSFLIQNDLCIVYYYLNKNKQYTNNSDYGLARQFTNNSK